MRPGFWQIVLLVVLVALFFHRPIIALFRSIAGGARFGDGSGGGACGTEPSRCYNCGAMLPRDSRFCPRCGRSQDVIDV
jgi:hypothetical protein